MAPMVKKKQQEVVKDDDNNDGIMLSEVRKKPTAFDFLKVVLKYAFSQAGVVFLCIGYAVIGANIYISMEEPLEMERFAAKTEAANEIFKMEEFMAGSYWDMIHHKYPEKRLNETQFEEKVNESLYTFIEKVVTANGEVSFDGNNDTWDKSWTFPNSLLFTVTIMTTVGYGHISPKSENGENYQEIFYREMISYLQDNCSR